MHMFSLQHQGSPDFSELIALVSESLTHNLLLCKAVLPISHGMPSSAKFSNSKGQGQNGNEKAMRSTGLILQTAFLNAVIKELALKWFKFLADFLNDSILFIHFPLSASLAGPTNFNRKHLPYCLSFQDMLSLKLPLTRPRNPHPGSCCGGLWQFSAHTFNCFLEEYVCASRGTQRPTHQHPGENISAHLLTCVLKAKEDS